MSFQPDNGGGGAADPNVPLPSTQIPNKYNPNKTVRYVYDCMSVTAVLPFNNGVIASGTVNIIGFESENRVCVWDIYSSTTANSGAWLGLSQVGCPHSANPVFTVHFKTPAAFDANSVIQIGTSSTGGTDRSAIEITGSTAQVKNIVGGSTTASGGTYTLTANTWYIARIEYKGDSNAVFSIYSETGTLLYTYTVTVALFNGASICVRAFNSGTVAKQLVKLDYMEVSFPVNNRYYLE
jgi:hypothetical protein